MLTCDFMCQDEFLHECRYRATSKSSQQWNNVGDRVSVSECTYECMCVCGVEDWYLIVWITGAACKMRARELASKEGNLNLTDTACFLFFPFLLSCSLKQPMSHRLSYQPRAPLKKVNAHCSLSRIANAHCVAQ